MNTDLHVVIEHLRGQVSEISYVMLAAGRALAQGTGGEVVALLLGNDAQMLAKDLDADKVFYVNHAILADFSPDAYMRVISGLVQEHSPRAVLFGHTTIGMDVASGLSARLGLPVISQCQTLHAEGGALHFTSQICGGKIMAEGELPEPAALVTLVPGGYKPDQGKSEKAPEITQTDAPALDDLRITLKEYIEPEVGDVDISKEAILIAVGRGLQNQDDLELIDELAEALGGAVCASRPIVDQGWLETSRLVGKSGLTVKPKLYIALGISGAPEHVEGITSSDLIIAVNTDPNAPIFDVAKYGVEGDMLDVVSALTEQVQKVRVG